MLNFMKKTKIVSTIGPATDSKETLKAIIDNGVNVVRQNFSHVDHEAHEELYNKVREVSNEVAIMADTKGPEIRLEKVKENLELEKNDKVVLKTKETDFEGDKEKLPVSYQKLDEQVNKGDKIRIDDGKIELEVLNTNNGEIETKILFGGEVASRKAINVPGQDIGLSAPTEKDRKDIRFAANKGFDFISLSFVKKSEDVVKVREILEEEDSSDVQIISKIEHKKAVENFEEILEESDAIMVARGDLGVEMPPEKLPKYQKEMIRKCNKAGKPVITATQMLESMTENSTATRAEISDVGNAVVDGTDAVMLSGETAMGDYPVKTVKFMSEIVEEAEKIIQDKIHHKIKQKPRGTTEIISKSVWQASNDTDNDHVVPHTSSGKTAKQIAKHRPKDNIIAFTDREIVKRQLQLVWGVDPHYLEFLESTDELIHKSAQKIRDKDLADPEDELILTVGVPTAKKGTTNTMQMRSLEEILEE